METKQKILVIVGPTASGKTSLSISLAQKFNGEIISADSRQVYWGLDLGTGKVTKDEMRGVPHHLLDVADPQDTYTAHQFVEDAQNVATEIYSRGKLPIVVGGTFFYIDSFLGRVSAPDVKPNEELRSKLQTMSAEALYGALQQTDERRAADIDPHNKRRLIRALEIVAAVGKVPVLQSNELYETFTIGVSLDKNQLYKNIHERLCARLAAGMIDEVKRLYEQGISYERMDELGLEYRYISRFLEGLMTREEMASELEIKIRQFAKRQMTWLKRDKTIKWFGPDEFEKISEEVEKFLKS